MQDIGITLLAVSYKYQCCKVPSAFLVQLKFVTVLKQTRYWLWQNSYSVPVKCESPQHQDAFSYGKFGFLNSSQKLKALQGSLQDTRLCHTLSMHSPIISFSISNFDCNFTEKSHCNFTEKKPLKPDSICSLQGFGEYNFFSNVYCHMIKVAVLHFSKIFFFRIKKPMSLELGVQHLELVYY